MNDLQIQMYVAMFFAVVVIPLMMIGIDAYKASMATLNEDDSNDERIIKVSIEMERWDIITYLELPLELAIDDPLDVSGFVRGVYGNQYVIEVHTPSGVWLGSSEI